MNVEHERLHRIVENYQDYRSMPSIFDEGAPSIFSLHNLL